MIVQAFAFYMFAALTVFAGVMVVASRNPVHSVLYMILAFFNAAGLFVLQGAEFLAMILVVVYVGAVAVLFMFVVMMLDIDFALLRKGFMKYLPLGAALGAVLLAELLIALHGGMFAPRGANSAAAAPPPEAVTNTHALGRILYTDYVYLFQAAGLVLLVAMIGAIVLTHRQRPGTRRQSVHRQLSLRAADRIEVRKVPTGKGI